MEPVVALAERLDCPVITTFKGKGVIPDSHPLAGGVLGRSGTPVASWFMNESDATTRGSPPRYPPSRWTSIR